MSEQYYTIHVSPSKCRLLARIFYFILMHAARRLMCYRSISYSLEGKHNLMNCCDAGNNTGKCLAVLFPHNTFTVRDLHCLWDMRCIVSIKLFKRREKIQTVIPVNFAKIMCSRRTDGNERV